MTYGYACLRASRNENDHQHLFYHNLRPLELACFWFADLDRLLYSLNMSCLYHYELEYVCPYQLLVVHSLLSLDQLHCVLFAPVQKGQNLPLDLHIQIKNLKICIHYSTLYTHHQCQQREEMTYGYACPLVSEACLCCLLGGAFFVHHLQNNKIYCARICEDDHLSGLLSVLRSRKVDTSKILFSWSHGNIHLIAQKHHYLSRSPFKRRNSTIQKAYLQNQLIHQNQTHLKQKILFTDHTCTSP